MSDTVQGHITVDAPFEVVFDVIADFAAYPEWQEEIKDAEVLETDEDGWGRRARFVVDAKLFTMEFVLAYTYTDSAMQWDLEESDSVRVNRGSYELVDLGGGRTEASYSLEVVPAVPMPGLLRRQAARRIVDAALRQMKERAESLA